VVDIPELITYANFGEDRLSGLGVTGGVKVCASPLALIVALTTLAVYRASVWCDCPWTCKVFQLRQHSWNYKPRALSDSCV